MDKQYITEHEISTAGGMIGLIIFFAVVVGIAVLVVANLSVLA